jgi:hypothetical protein
VEVNLGTVNGEPRTVNASLPVLRDSRIAVPDGVSCGPVSKEPQHAKKHKNMDLNAYVLAMAIAGAPRHQKNRQTAPEPAFKPFDLRHLRGLPMNTSQPRHIGRQRKVQNNVSEALPA